jgi:group I intron endonuclease
VETLETVGSMDELNAREQFWISDLNSLAPNGYNLCSGGMNGRISSEETKERQSNFMKGKTGDAHPAFGHKKSEEWKKRQSELTKTQKITPEIRKNMSEAAKKRKNNVRPCSLISDSGENLEFTSLKEAGKFLGCTACNLNYYIKKNKPINNYTIVVKGK